MTHRQFKRWVVCAGVFFTSAFGSGLATYLELQEQHREQIRQEERIQEERHKLREALAKYCNFNPTTDACKGRPGPTGLDGRN